SLTAVIALPAGTDPHPVPRLRGTPHTLLTSGDRPLGRLRCHASPFYRQRRCSPPHLPWPPVTAQRNSRRPHPPPAARPAPPPPAAPCRRRTTTNRRSPKPTSPTGSRCWLPTTSRAVRRAA